MLPEMGETNDIVAVDNTGLQYKRNGSFDSLESKPPLALYLGTY